MAAKKEISLEVLAKELNGQLVGGENSKISSIKDMAEAQKGDLVFLFAKKYKTLLEKTKASCCVVPEDLDKAPIPIIKCKDPNLAFKKTVELLKPDYIPHPRGVHKTAMVAENVKLGEGVALGAYACVEEGAEIGSGTVVYSNSYVGTSSKIGKECIIYPNVTIRENVKIGNRVIIHSGTVVGSDGFGYARTEAGHQKVPQIGDVIIEDDVELGACVTIDRAKIAHTRIGKGTKVDNLVQIAHNVTIGQNCIIVAQTGISGSVKIGNNVVIGGQVGFVQHIEVGDNAQIAAQSGVMKSVPPKAIVGGSPARPIKQAIATVLLIDKLPELYKKFKSAEKVLTKFGIK